VAFGLLIVFLLGLPVVLNALGLPPREQVYAAMAHVAGEVGYIDNLIYKDPQQADVVLVGSSIVREDILDPRLEKELTRRSGRPFIVRTLALNYQGLDQEYFLLRDYLENHHPGLVVVNIPQLDANTNAPAYLSFKWIRYGEYSEDLDGLPRSDRAKLYGEMVLGAPRQLLSKFRPNLIAPEELTNHYDTVRRYGYHGGPLISDTVPLADRKDSAHAIPVTSDTLRVEGEGLNSYELHFLLKIQEVVKQHGTKLVLLHCPTDIEYGLSYVPEMASWSDLMGPNEKIIAIPSAKLFPGINKDRFLHFYTDNHMNVNGAELFTDALAPAILEAYGK
jgi:hypothetical protein